MHLFHWLTDPVRQVVLDELESDYRRTIDPATLQFLREKHRSGWRLYEVTFREIDGEQHRAIYILWQNEAGFWFCRFSSSSSDIQKHWSDNFASVHDHPFLFLNLIEGVSSGDQYSLHVYGDVIDNGFHVERVRLITNTGRVFEDTVKDGLVYFVGEQQQLIPFSMQAELYNHEGKLVWKQMVPDRGLLKKRQQ